MYKVFQRGDPIGKQVQRLRAYSVFCCSWRNGVNANAIKKGNRMVTEEKESTLQVALDAAMSFDMSDIVARYRHDYEVPEIVAREHETELKKYLALCAAHPGKHYGMTPVIDDLWHTFLVFTREYARFCKQVAGRFLHHAPTKDEEKRDGSAVQNYLMLLEDYTEVFGDPPAHIWPRPNHRSSTHEDGEGCQGCQGCGVRDSAGGVTLDADGCGGCNGCHGCSTG
jgi:uncharacterized protein involved in tolerance to divalent cations